MFINVISIIKLTNSKVIDDAPLFATDYCLARFAMHACEYVSPSKRVCSGRCYRYLFIQNSFGWRDTAVLLD